MIRILEILFPPQLPKMSEPLQEVESFDAERFDSIGRVQRKPYRDAIDRHWKTQQ